MQITIKKLGPIEEASVDLSKDLIVITGQNNTGKTYLMYAIYHLFQTIKTNKKYNVFENRFKINIQELANLQNKIYLIINKHVYNKETIEINLLDYIDDYCAISTPFFDDIISDYIVGIASLFESNENTFEKTRLAINISQQNIINLIKNIHFDYYSTGFKTFYILSKNDVHVSKEKNTSKIKVKINQISTQESIDYLAYFISLIPMVQPYWVNLQMEVAERSALNLIAPELLFHRRNFEQKNTYISLYSKPIQNYIYKNDLNQRYIYNRQKSKFAYLADELENKILIGSLKMNADDGLKYKPQKGDNYLSLHLTSSVVKSLVGLAFYLRHEAKENDIIMIDEPELSLHPDNQRRIARFLGRLVNEGFKVIISTHSDYIIKELNLLIMLSKKSTYQAELLQKYGYNANQLLKPSQIQALFFRQEQGIPENVAVGETGFTIASIDDTIEQIENTTEDVYFQLFEQEEVEI